MVAPGVVVSKESGEQESADGATAGAARRRRTCSLLSAPTRRRPAMQTLTIRRPQPVAIAVAIRYTKEVARAVARPRGSGSVVEHLLAKEGVASSNLVFRSNDPGAERDQLPGFRYLCSWRPAGQAGRR